MDKLNNIQKELVEQSERIHYSGIRHKGLSGTICEDLLIEKLRKLIPELEFSRGVIKFCNPTLQGNDIKIQDLSTQIDIIVYKGKPIFKIQGIVVIGIDQVLAVVEIKKWTYPKMLKPDSTFIKKLKDTKDALCKKANREIPVFCVSYRFHDRKCKEINWFTENNNIPTKYAYCFFGRFSRKNGRNLYPWEENEWQSFKDNKYRGQFEQFIVNLKILIK